MISVSIVAIILTFVAPSLQSILIKNRIVAEINELSALIQYARHHAIDEQGQTIICPSVNYSNCSNDWADPKIVFVDDDDNGVRGANETLLVTIPATSDINLITGPGNTLRFTGNGEASFATSILLCHQNKEAKYARSLSISLQGRVKMSSDSDRDGINEADDGSELAC
jgi:type IV fimbrial biogenesis protein FimT